MAKRKHLIILSSLIFTQISYAETLKPQIEITAGRYIITDTKPEKQQENLLNVVTSIKFSEDIVTVGAAINATLMRSGYRLASAETSDPKLPVLLNSPLPYIHKSFDNVAVSKILQVLASDVWELVVDPLHRLISFELNEKYMNSNNNSMEINQISLITGGLK